MPLNISGTGKNRCLLLAEQLEEKEQNQADFALTTILHRGGWQKKDFFLCLVSPGTIDFSFIPEQFPTINTIIPLDAATQYALIRSSDIKNFHGAPLRWQDYWVIPTKHPQMVLKGGFKEVPASVWDIGRALEVSRNSWKPSTISYIEHPDLAALNSFIQEYEEALILDPLVFLSVDIETPNSATIDEDEREDADPSYHIDRISFAFKENHAITLLFEEPFLDGIKRLLASNGLKLFWNGNKFDVPRLRFNSCIINGMIVDMLDGWHFLYPDLPRSLGYVSQFFCDIAPWKHLSQTNPEYYSCVDADAALRNGNGIRRELIKLGMWDIFIRDIVNIEPVFQDLHEVGIGINEDKRAELRKFYEELRDNATSIIQRKVPEAVRPWVKKDGYKGKPKDVRDYYKEHPELVDYDCWTNCGYTPFPISNGQSNESIEGRWNKRGEFNPNSPNQIIEYITMMYGPQAVPRHKKTGAPTTGEDELERLAKQKKDRVLELIVDAGNAGTQLSNFINNWKVGYDKKVHPIFTNNPSTFRLSSKTPNSQNYPSRSEEAQKMREMIIPGDGWKYLIEADFTGIEAILVGWYANDPDYIRLAMRGVHDYFSAHMMAKDGKFERVPLTLSDNDLTIALKEAKKVGKKLLAPGTLLCYRDVAKQIIHGSNYKEGPVLMHKSYPDCFPTVRSASIPQDEYFEVFPKIPIWQNKVVDSAYLTGKVQNAFGYHRRFYNVKRWSWNKPMKKWELVWADDAKKAIATIPQGSAAAIIRRAMLSEEYLLLRQAQAAMIQVHDSLLNRAKDEAMRDWVIEQVVRAMVFPIPELGGMDIPVEVKVGENWGKMETIQI